MAVAIDDVEHQTRESVVMDSIVLRSSQILPAARIVFVPFALVEVELLPDEEYKAPVQV